MKYFWFLSPTQLFILQRKLNKYTCWFFINKVMKYWKFEEKLIRSLKRFSMVSHYHGQWWSILLIHLLQILQWWARGGLYVSHLVQTVQSSLSSLSSKLDSTLWISEKSILACGKGTTPGSLHTALRCDIINNNMTVLKMTTWNGPHKLKHLKFNCFCFNFTIRCPIIIKLEVLTNI